MNTFIKKNKTNSGFTVMELMVVIGIMVMMMAITLPNFKGFSINQMVDTEADKLFSVLRQAQIWALTGQTVGSVRYNYGVHITKCSIESDCHYILFYDNSINGNKTYNSGEEMAGGDRVFLKGVYTTMASDVLDVVFNIPLGKVYFNGIPAEGEQIITLKGSATDRIRTISINGISGQINVK